MADLIDGAGSTAGQVVREVGRGSATVAKGATRLSVRVTGGMFKGVGSLYGVARKAARSRSTTGEVRLKVFTREAHGKREVVPVKDAEVARMFVRELRRHGVLFAVEAHRDGTRTFHVQGQDASVIEHALSVAIAGVDAALTRTQQAGERPDPAAMLRAKDTSTGAPQVDDAGPGERVLNLTDEQKATLVETLRTTPENLAVDKATSTELADLVERDSAVELTEANVDTIDAALGEPGEEPAGLSEIADAVEEEKAAIAAGADDATRDLAVPEDAQEIPGEPVSVALPTEDLDSTVTVVLSDRERDTLVEGLQNAAAADQAVAPERLTELAETVEQESRVVLTPENIATLEQAFAAHGWTPGADDDRTPEHMRWIVEAVAEEHQALGIAPAPEAPATVVEDATIAPAVDAETPAPTANPFLTNPAEAVEQPLPASQQEREVTVTAEEYEAELGPFNPDDLPVPEPDPFDSDPAAWDAPDEEPPTPGEAQRSVNPYLARTVDEPAPAPRDPYLAAAEAGVVGTDERWLQLEERMREPLPEPSPEVAAVMAEMIQGDHDEVVYKVLDNMKVQPDADPARTLAIIRGASELHVDPGSPSTKAALEVVEAMGKPGLFEGSVHEAAARRLSSVLQKVPEPSRTAEAVQLGLSRRETTRERLAARIETKAAELKATYAAQALQRTRRPRGASKGK